MPLAHCLDRSLHRRAGRETVVDENDNSPFERRGRPPFEVGLLAAIELELFLACDQLDLFRRDAEPADNLVVEDADPAGGNRPHRQLALTGGSELSHEEDVEWCAKRLGHLEGN